MASFANLDDALLEQVALHLPLEDLCRACRVCSRLRAVIMGAQEVWRGLFEATYGSSSGSGAGGDREAATAAAGGGQQAQQQAQQQRQAAATRGTAGRQAASASASRALASAAAAGRSGWPPEGGPAAVAPRLESSSRGRQQLGKRRRGEGEEPPGAATTQVVAGAAAGAGAAAAAAAQTSESSSWRERFKTRYVEEARKQRLKRQARRLKAESTLQVLRLDVHRLEQALVQEQRQLPQLQAQLAALQKARQQASAAALAQVYWQPVAVQQAHGQGVAAVQQPLDAEGAEQDLQQRVAVSQLEVRKLTAALQAARRRAGEAQRKLQALLP